MTQYCHILHDMSWLVSRGRFPRHGAALSAASSAPVGQPPFCELNVSALGALPFLAHYLQGKQYLAESPLLGKEQSVNHAFAIDFDLPDISSQLIDISVTAACVTHLFHRGRDSRRILIG
jgi:hypothetical protein